MKEKQTKQSFFKEYLGNFRYKLFQRGIFTGMIATSVYAYLVGLKILRREKAALKEELMTTGIMDYESGDDKAKKERSREILKYGIPDRGPQIRYYTNHVMAYDQQKKTPIWVGEHLTADRLKGDVSRKNIRFKPDPRIVPEFSAANSDYKQSVWCLGHMSPAGDNKHTRSAMVDSFYLSNIVPQNHDNNEGFWNRLEMYCRDLANKYSNVYIISGPLVLPETGEDGKHFVKYPVIGENQVAVPTHLFKVILVESMSNTPTAIGAFVVPNKPIGYEHHLKEYQVPIKDLEKMAGMNLVSGLKQTELDNLCEVEGCKLMTRDQFEMYYIGRKLESATTLNRLEKVWSELEKKKLTADTGLTTLYNKKKLAIQNSNSTKGA